MWIVLFILALLFVLGGALILLRSAKTSKIPDNVKSQPYDEDDSDIWQLLSVSQHIDIFAGVYFISICFIETFISLDQK